MMMMMMTMTVMIRDIDKIIKDSYNDEDVDGD